MESRYDVTAGYDRNVYECLMTMNIPKKEGYMPFVYVCSPFQGDEIGNMKRARVYSRFVFMNNCIPICPHIYFPQFVSEATERDKVMHMNLILLRKCQEVWVFGNEITEGMKSEIEIATNRKTTIVRYFSDDLKEKE